MCPKTARAAILAVLAFLSQLASPALADILPPPSADGSESAAESDAAPAAPAAPWRAPASAGQPEYDYEDIIPKYCHETLDWGPIPEKPLEAGRLLQVQVFIRHGARTQAKGDTCWEGDDQGHFTCSLNYLENSVDDRERPLTPYFRTEFMEGRNSLSGNCLAGQLVKDGFEMQRRNGLRLRQAYVKKEQLSIGDAFFRSTDVPRTKQSGMALLSGLFGGRHFEDVPHIRLNTMDNKEENMIPNEKVCPSARKMSVWIAENLPSVDCCALLDMDADKHTAAECCDSLVHTVDCLMSRTCSTVPFSPHNSTVPDKFLKEDAAFMRKLWKIFDEAAWLYFKAMRDAGASGPFVAEILAAAEGAISGSGGGASSSSGGGAARAFMLWSGHDTGPMGPLYAAFDLRARPPYWPSFASMLALEIWEGSSSSGPLVRWISDGEVAAGPMPFGEFRRKASDAVRNAHHCHDEGSSHDKTSAAEGRFSIYLVVLIVGMVCLVLTVCAGVCMLVYLWRSHLAQKRKDMAQVAREMQLEMMPVGAH